MKKCNSCDISVGGGWVHCPLCHSKLIGESSPELWPKKTQLNLKIRTMLYKSQLFVALCIIVLFLVYDFVLTDPNARSVHISIIVAVWIVAFEMVLRRALNRIMVVARLINECGILIVLLLIFTSYHLGFFKLCLVQITPIEIAVLLVINFIFALSDKNDNVMIFLIFNILMGIIPYIAQFILLGRSNMTYSWNVCVIIGILSFLGIAVFKGHRMWAELEKRMHM